MSLFFLLDSPPIPVGNQLATPAAQYPPTPSDPVSNLRPRPAGFVANPATARDRGDSVNDTSAENVSGAREAREHVQRLIDSWIGDAKTVLIFVSPARLIFAFYRTDLFKRTASSSQLSHRLYSTATNCYHQILDNKSHKILHPLPPLRLSLLM
jgi:hypothetical protein